MDSPNKYFIYIAWMFFSTCIFSCAIVLQFVFEINVYHQLLFLMFLFTVHLNLNAVFFFGSKVQNLACVNYRLIFFYFRLQMSVGGVVRMWWSRSSVVARDDIEPYFLEWARGVLLFWTRTLKRDILCHVWIESTVFYALK